MQTRFSRATLRCAYSMKDGSKSRPYTDVTAGARSHHAFNFGYADGDLLPRISKVFVLHVMFFDELLPGLEFMAFPV